MNESRRRFSFDLFFVQLQLQPFRFDFENAMQRFRFLVAKWQCWADRATTREWKREMKTSSVSIYATTTVDVVVKRCAKEVRNKNEMSKSKNNKKNLRFVCWAADEKFILLHSIRSDTQKTRIKHKMELLSRERERKRSEIKRNAECLNLSLAFNLLIVFSSALAALNMHARVSEKRFSWFRAMTELRRFADDNVE